MREAETRTPPPEYPNIHFTRPPAALVGETAGLHDATTLNIPVKQHIPVVMLTFEAPVKHLQPLFARLSCRDGGAGSSRIDVSGRHFAVVHAAHQGPLS